jgi:hypothetical protein
MELVFLYFYCPDEFSRDIVRMETHSWLQLMGEERRMGTVNIVNVCNAGEADGINGVLFILEIGKY